MVVTAKTAQVIDVDEGDSEGDAEEVEVVENSARGREVAAVEEQEG